MDSLLPTRLPFVVVPWLSLFQRFSATSLEALLRLGFRIIWPWVLMSHFNLSRVLAYSCRVQSTLSPIDGISSFTRFQIEHEHYSTVFKRKLVAQKVRNWLLYSNPQPSNTLCKPAWTKGTFIKVMFFFNKNLLKPVNLKWCWIFKFGWART
jgi:hypothetical protein